MNHTTAVPVQVVEHYRDLVGRPGAVQFFVDDVGLAFVCPCGCGTQGSIPFTGKVEASTVSWQWDGNRTQPSLTPSIRRTSGCKWHGHLQHGAWTPCSDSGQ